jgi:hypothetical protein
MAVRILEKLPLTIGKVIVWFVAACMLSALQLIN